MTGVPDSSISAAIGFAEEAGIPYEIGAGQEPLRWPHIHPADAGAATRRRARSSSTRCARWSRGSASSSWTTRIVRGTTSARLIDLVREAGATEAHMRISSPPVTHPCYYGIDTSDRTKLIAANQSVAEIQRRIGADSLAYLTEEQMLDAFGVSDRSAHPLLQRLLYRANTRRGSTIRTETTRAWWEPRSRSG